MCMTRTLSIDRHLQSETMFSRSEDCPVAQTRTHGSRQVSETTFSRTGKDTTPYPLWPQEATSPAPRVTARALGHSMQMEPSPLRSRGRLNLARALGHSPLSPPLTSPPQPRSARVAARPIQQCSYRSRGQRPSARGLGRATPLRPSISPAHRNLVRGAGPSTPSRPWGSHAPPSSCRADLRLARRRPLETLLYYPSAPATFLKSTVRMRCQPCTGFLMYRTEGMGRIDE